MQVVLDHFAELAAAVSIPLNADFENGFAHDPDGVAENVARCVATGVAGLSIEDFTGDESKPIYEFDHAVARVKAARAAIDKAGGDVVLTGACRRFPARTARPRRRHQAPQGLLAMRAPIAFTYRGIKTREQIDAVVKAVAPKPVNFLNAAPLGFTVKDLEDLGVRRISVGGTLARVAMNAFAKSAREIAETGKFDSFAGIMSNAELQHVLRRLQGQAVSDTLPETGQPIGAKVDATPAQLPGPGDAQGPLRPRRAAR